ncbi:MAG: Clp1/GlmU family protein [Acidilobaceae archaeon]
MELYTREISLDGFLAVRGPAVVVVAGGLVEAMGFPVGAGFRLVVPRARAVLLRGENARIQVSGSPGSALVELSSGEIEEAYSVAREAARRKSMIVGPVDSGKSTLASLVAGLAAASGARPELLTIDVGQNEVYCPGFASLASVNPPVVPGSTASFTVERSCFVGSFTPSAMLERYKRCSLELSQSPPPLVIDTDGWVEERGLQAKAEIAVEAGVELVVALGLDREKLAVFESRGLEVASLKPLARSAKTSEERRLHRERLIASKLAGARRYSVPLDSVVFLGDQRPRPGAGLIAAVYVKKSPHPGLLVRVDERKGKAVVLAPVSASPELVEAGVSEVSILEL